MPYLYIETNQTVTDPDSLLKACSRATADALGKSEKFVMTNLRADTPMTFGGDAEACAFLSLKSIGLQSSQTRALSERLCELLSERLNVPVNRIYIEFVGVERAFWGWNGGTFEK